MNLLKACLPSFRCGSGGKKSSRYALKKSLIRRIFFDALRDRFRRKRFRGFFAYALRLFGSVRISDAEWARQIDFYSHHADADKVLLIDRYLRLIRKVDTGTLKDNPFIACLVEELRTRKLRRFRKYADRFPCIYEFHIQRPLPQFERLFLNSGWIAAVGHFSYLKLIKDHLSLEGLEKTELFLDFSSLPPKSNPYLLEAMAVQYELHDYRSAGEPLLDCPYVPLKNGELRHMYTLGERTLALHDHECCPHNLRFPEKDEDACADILRQLGVQRGEWFVAVHCRDTGFRENGRAGLETRNTDIRKLNRTFDHIAKQGGKIIRMGNPSMPSCLHPSVIDYAHSPLRSPMMDIYLAAKCRFMIGSMSGMTHVPSLFGVPILYVDATPFRALNVMYKVDYALPQLMVNEETGEMLPFSEYFERNLFVLQNPTFVKLSGLRLIETTEEDIFLTAQHVLQHGFQSRSPEAERLALRLQERGCATVGRFPDHFIAKHRALFG